jgi:hypothetical protein
MEKNNREAYLQRLARYLEREAHFAGVDIECEITRILEKLDGARPRNSNT